MDVAEISTEIKEGFKKLALVVALVVFASAFLLGSIACFIVSCFSEGKTFFVIYSIVLSGTAICLLYLYYRKISSKDKRGISGADIVIEERDIQPENRIVEVEADSES